MRLDITVKQASLQLHLGGLAHELRPRGVAHTLSGSGRVNLGRESWETYAAIPLAKKFHAELREREVPVSILAFTDGDWRSAIAWARASAVGLAGEVASSIWDLFLVRTADAKAVVWFYSNENRDDFASGAQFNVWLRLPDLLIPNYDRMVRFGMTHQSLVTRATIDGWHVAPTDASMASTGIPSWSAFLKSGLPAIAGEAVVTVE